jgi:hypothetical protein
MNSYLPRKIILGRDAASVVNYHTMVSKMSPIGIFLDLWSHLLKSMLKTVNPRVARAAIRYLRSKMKIKTFLIINNIQINNQL